MKHTKKIFVFILTIAIVLTFGQVVLAEEPNSGEPQPQTLCLVCGTDTGWYPWTDYDYKIQVTRCAYSANPHEHIHYTQYYSNCMCHIKAEQIGSGIICPYGGYI